MFKHRKCERTIGCTERRTLVLPDLSNAALKIRDAHVETVELVRVAHHGAILSDAPMPNIAPNQSVRGGNPRMKMTITDLHQWRLLLGGVTQVSPLSDRRFR